MSWIFFYFVLTLEFWTELSYDKYNSAKNTEAHQLEGA